MGMFHWDCLVDNCICFEVQEQCLHSQTLDPDRGSANLVSILLCVSMACCTQFLYGSIL